MKNISFLALIPARGGSKRLPNKNIKPLCHRPLIAHTIECAKESQIFDRIVVSTDSSEIADVAKNYGAHVPFIRPANLSTDNATSIDVVLHAMKWHEDNDKKYDFVILLQPTSPLRLPLDIKDAVKLCLDKEADAIVSVGACNKSPQWINTLPEDLSMINFIKSFENENAVRSPYYQINGALYLARWDYLKNLQNWYSTKTYAYIMPPERSVDIDSIVDFTVAETIKKRIND